MPLPGSLNLLSIAVASRRLQLSCPRRTATERKFAKEFHSSILNELGVSPNLPSSKNTSSCKLPRLRSTLGLNGHRPRIQFGLALQV